MTTLPCNRYTGAECFSAVDAGGKQFLAFQGPNNTGKLVLIAGGVATDITPAATTGRPSLEVNPHAGLYFIGNQETPANEPPTRTPVPQYTPWPAPAAQPIVVPAASPLWQLWHGQYAAADFDTPAETALRVEKQLKALNALIDALVAAGIIVKG